MDMNQLLEKWFHLKKHQTSVKIEILAGLTTFLTMAYIIFVNPSILATTGMDSGAVFTATCLITAAATLMSAFIANSPIAIAPGMALNAFFAFVVVPVYGYTWQNALGMVFISGIVFVLLTVTKIRSLLIKSLPECLSSAVLVGISLFIALIALKTNHIIVISKNDVMHLGDLSRMESVLFFVGFLLIIFLDYLKVPAAILIGLVTLTAINTLVNHTAFQGFFALPPSISPNFMAFEFNQLHTTHAFGQIFSFVLIALFDATGTLIGLLHKPLFIQFKNSHKKIEQTLLSDSVATTFAAVLGSSSTSPFIESAAGIEAGGRTGLTALVISALFIISLFLSPLVSLIPSFAVGATLLYIACCIMKDMTRLNTEDLTDFAPSVLTFLMIPFSLSIADGIGIGIISYVLLKAATKQWYALNPMLIILTLVFILYFINNGAPG